MNRLAPVLAVLAVLLAGCAGSSETEERPKPSARETSPPSSSPPAIEVGVTPSPGRLQLVEDEQAPVDPDLERLARTFVRYALGDTDTFPHWESVSLSIGGQVVAYIDDISAALSNREIWKVCPADWKQYGESSCPVDLFGPIRNAVLNDGVIVYSAKQGDVTCAPTRTGPLPHGRMVVLRPGPDSRTCATDFALALVADEHGQLRHVDLTLSAP